MNKPTRKAPQKPRQTVRIIAGHWRGRKISFHDYDNAIRPTPDRVRETLFNWLAPYIVDANCLDLYAGSGVLGLEALSRGAANVIAVEQQRKICQDILAVKELLHATLTVVQADVAAWLTNNGRPFDIIFLDPPYNQNVLPNCLQLLHNNHWVKNGSLIYYENNSAILADSLPQHWHVLKEDKAGQVYYYLAQVGD
jgi:16S rRNA (guanine966-N2)-methyltransferase